MSQGILTARRPLGEFAVRMPLSDVVPSAVGGPSLPLRMTDLTLEHSLAGPRLATKNVANLGHRANILFMEPISTVTSAWTIVKTAGEVSKKLFEFSKGLKDHEAKQRLDEIVDQLRELKQSASELEDENRGLREKLRFKTDEYEFQNPHWYHKMHPDQPLCPICFSKEIAAPISSASGWCLVCKGHSF